MKEASWEHFMATGKIEDYLKFKREEEKKNSKFPGNDLQRNNRKEREQLRAGFSKGDSHGSGYGTYRGV